eukprot:443791_1
MGQSTSTNNKQPQSIHSSNVTIKHPPSSPPLNKLGFRNYGKGRVHISYSDREHILTQWTPYANTQYKPGDLVYFPAIYNDAIKFWSMCMQTHTSTLQSKPNRHATFSDLLLEIIPALESHLVPQIAQIVIDYAYLPNEYWWNGCNTILNKNKTRYWLNKVPNSFDIDEHKFIKESCGKLVCLESTYQCKECYHSIEHNNDATINKQYGAIIKFNKEQVIRQSGPKTVYDKLYDIVLQKGIQSNYQKKQIRNLLWRNFNDSMAPLIEALLETNPNKHAFVEKFKIRNLNESNIGIWSLYNKSKTEILCALIWRCIRGQIESCNCHINYSGNGETCVMFEVLFLSTSEHVRHQKIANEMVKRIEVFARLNCYDIISVAAVPNQGISFWSQNAFETFVFQNEPVIKFDENIGYVTKRNRIRQFIQRNMLVFNDTPLLVKVLL